MYRAKLIVVAFVLAIIFMSFIQMFLDFLALVINSSDPISISILLVSLTLLFYIKLNNAQGGHNE